MKVILTVNALILAVAFLALPLFAASPAAANADGLVPLLGFDVVTVGTHRSHVTERIGDPPDRFSPDVWVYWDYRDPRRAADERYKTLVIIFSDDWVSRMRFTDTTETRAALAKFRRDQAIATLLLTSMEPLTTGNKFASIRSENPEMSAAIHEARASIRTFLDAFIAPTAEQSSFLVRVAFVKDASVEHIWLANLDLSGAKPTGVISTPPLRKDLRLKQRVEVDLTHLSDWMYVDDGKLVGGFTTRLLRKRMSQDERTKTDAGSPYRVDQIRQ